ncbi:unnamed protein product [Alternaria alternata]
MQALTVLMIAISCPGHFRDSLPVSCHSVRQLVSFLRGMRETNTLAARAYQFIYSIVKTSKPFIWDDVADAFPDEDIIVLQQPAAGRVDPKYSPWPDNDQPVEALFKYELMCRVQESLSRASSDRLPTLKQQPTIATLDLVPEHDTPSQTGLYNK